MTFNAWQNPGINSLFLYEGKAKKVFKYGDDEVMIYFKDDATAGNRAKQSLKAKVNLMQISVVDYLVCYINIKSTHTL